MKLQPQQIKDLAKWANFICPLCQFTTSTRANLRKHLREHTFEDAKEMGVL